MRSRILGAAALFALLTATACGGGDPPATAPDISAGSVASSPAPAVGGTLTVGRTESFDGWVLDSAAAYSTYQTHPAVFEPLLRFTADGANVEPGLAEKWGYDEATTTWTFTLRSNAKFSNGQPVTSADVVFSFGVWSAGVNFGGSLPRSPKSSRSIRQPCPS
jgi:peptide/nickel transport system substrate-binding protein